MNIKERADAMMKSANKGNPDADWKHLAAGLGLFALVIIFSVWYFSRDYEAPEMDVTGSETIMIDENGVMETDESMEEVMEGEEAMEQPAVGENETVVQRGEGLYRVAARVCGNGEVYNHLAEANGLTIYSELAEGQVLVVDCGPDAEVAQ